MQKASLAASLLILCLTLSGSYPTAAAASRSPLLSSAAAHRRSSLVFQPLLGQWTANGSRPHMVQVMKSEFLSLNQTEQGDHLKLATPLGWLQTATLRLAPNRTAIIELLKPTDKISD